MHGGPCPAHGSGGQLTTTCRTSGSAFAPAGGGASVAGATVTACGPGAVKAGTASASPSRMPLTMTKPLRTSAFIAAPPGTRTAMNNRNSPAYTGAYRHNLLLCAHSLARAAGGR
jgi:hypothetical protein